MIRHTFIPVVAGAVLLAPMLAFAQVTTAVNANVSADVSAGNVVHASLNASSTISASTADKAKTRADEEITRRTTALNDLLTRVGQMTRVTADFKASLQTSIQNQISSLTSLQAKIDADTDATTLKTDIQSITTSYRIYMLEMPQARIATAADRAVNIATMMNALSVKLQARMASSSDASLTAALSDLTAKTSDASTQAQAAVSATANLEPDNGDTSIEATNETALKAGRADIQTAQTDLTAARADIKTIEQGLKINVSAGASATAQ